MWGKSRVQVALPKPESSGHSVASKQLWQMWLPSPPMTAWCPASALLQELGMELAGSQD